MVSNNYQITIKFNRDMYIQILLFKTWYFNDLIYFETLIPRKLVQPVYIKKFDNRLTGCMKNNDDLTNEAGEKHYFM